MAETRARNFIERLPEIIDREEEDISHLDPEMVEILYPERASKEFTLSLVFGPPPLSQGASETDKEQAERKYQEAIEIARKSQSYRSEGTARSTRHIGTFSLERVEELHRLFTLVGDYPSCEVLVKGKRVPYAREFWLPMFWLFRTGEGH